MIFKNKPIKYQLIIHMIIVYATIVLILLLSYNMVADIMMSKSKTYTIDMTAKIKSNISTYYEEIKKITTYIAYNPYTQMFMKLGTSFEDYLLSKHLDNVCSNFRNIKLNIIDIIIYASSGDRYYKMSGEFSIEHFKKILPEDISNGDVYNTGFEGKKDYPNTKRESLVYYTNIYLNTEDGDLGKKAGTVGVVVDNRQIFQEIERISAGESNRYYLIDKNGTMLYNQYSDIDAREYTNIRNEIKEKNIGDEKQEVLDIDNKNILVYSTYIPEIECKLVSFIPLSEVFKELLIVKKIFIFIFICAALVLTIPMSVLLRNILHPLNKLIEFMNGLGKGNLKYLKKKIQIDGYWEIIEMSNNFNDMLSEIDNLTHRLIDTHSMLYEAELDKQKIEISRKTAELAYLRSQINPHFLYNTLESIKGVALDENAHRVFDMLKSLATIFRFSVKGTDFVTLEEEMNIVNAYAQIQIIRFGGRISIELNIDENSKRVKIPKMILQPLVENAIFHGLEGLEQNGMVKVSSFMNGDTLILKVEDNGVGIEEEKLERLREVISKVGRSIIEDSAYSIGVSNVNKRIKLIYGDECGISISSKAGFGTSVTLKIVNSEVAYAQSFYS